MNTDFQAINEKLRVGEPFDVNIADTTVPADKFRIHGLGFTRTPILYFADFKGNEVGRLEIKDGKLVFAGNADESAQRFIETLKDLWNKQ